MDIIFNLISAFPFIVILLSFSIGWSIMPYILKISKKKNMVITPNKRSAHTGSIPNVGGICTVSAFLISFLLCNAVFYFDISAFLFLTGLYIIFLVGFFDDILVFSPKQKIRGELLAALILIVLADMRLNNLYGIFGIYELPATWWGMLVSYVLSLFVFFLITNAINLIDGVDGLATGIGIEICLCMAIYFQTAGHVNEAVIAYLAIGASALFFFYNVFGNKSKIFMGDSGSLVLGYVIYSLVCLFCEKSITPEDYAAPAIAICILAIPLFDTARVMITRIKNGKSPFLADKNHVHHLLLSLGLKHKYVTFILLFANASFIALAYFCRHINNLTLIGLSVALFVAYIVILWRLVDRHNISIKNISEK